LYASTLIQDEVLEAFQYSNMDANDPNWYKLLPLPESCPFDKVLKHIVDRDSLHKSAVFHFARSVCCRDRAFPWLNSTFHVLNGSSGTGLHHIFLAAKLSELFECITAFRSPHSVTFAVVWKGIGTALVRSLSASNDRDKLLEQQRRQEREEMEQKRPEELELLRQERKKIEQKRQEDLELLLQDEFLITLGNDESTMRAAVLACFPRIDIDAFIDSARELVRAVEQVLYRDAVQACMKLISVVIHDAFVSPHDDVLSGTAARRILCQDSHLQVIR
jgi:hypothetical protein